MRAAVPGFRLRLRPSHRAASHPAGAGGITALVRQRGWPGFKVRGFGRWPILQSRASRLIPGDRSPGVTGHLAHDPRQRAVVHGKPTIDRLAGADRVNERFLLGEIRIILRTFLGRSPGRLQDGPGQNRDQLLAKVESVRQPGSPRPVAFCTSLAMNAAWAGVSSPLRRIWLTRARSSLMRACGSSQRPGKTSL